MNEVQQLQIQVQELSSKLAALSLSNENKDREIKELKNRLSKLENDRVEDKVLNKEIMMRLDSMNLDMKEIKEFIKEQKEQPGKDRKEFIKQVVGTIVSLSIGALFGWLSSKK